jgi:hypothetical protein
LVELRILSDALALATRQAGSAHQEPLRQPSKALRQWAIDERAWSADREGIGASGCPELMDWKQAAWDLDVAASDQWRHIASGSPDDLGAVRASIDALLLMGEEIERHPCETGNG